MAKNRTAGRPRNQEKMDAFARWWALPKSKRDPATLTAWGEENEVGQATLWRWKKNPDFRQAVLTLRLEVVDESMTDIIDGLSGKAKEGELGQAKFLMELMGDYTTKSQIEHKVTGGGGSGLNRDLVEFAAQEMLDHPKMPAMPLEDLVEILAETLLEEDED